MQKSDTKTEVVELNGADLPTIINEVTPVDGTPISTEIVVDEAEIENIGNEGDVIMEGENSEEVLSDQSDFIVLSDSEPTQISTTEPIEIESTETTTTATTEGETITITTTTTTTGKQGGTKIKSYTTHNTPLASLLQVPGKIISYLSNRKVHQKGSLVHSASFPNLHQALQHSSTTPAIPTPQNFAIPFIVPPSQAKEFFKHWLADLWFSPGDFRDRGEVANMKALFLPYYIFSVNATTFHYGFVGFPKSGNLDPTVGEEGYDWKPEETPPTNLHFPRIDVYAPRGSLIGDSEDIKYSHEVPRFDCIEGEVDNWNMDYRVPFNPSSTQPLTVGPKAESFLPIIHLPLSPSSAWTNFGYRKLCHLEASSADVKLRKSCGAVCCRDVSSSTKADNLSAVIVYVPVYMWKFGFEGDFYTFLVNGQTGVYFGERPFGLPGNLRSSAIKFVTGNPFSHNSTRLSSGKELCTIYSTDIYEHTAQYLVFPPSDQFLFVVAIGYITLQNVDTDESFSLRAVRISREEEEEVGSEFVLRPQETATFSYRGGWCIKILSGPADKLNVMHVETNNGNDKPNSLGMV
eukprot:TRINITY_DN7306_c0_g1_i4.p1 TRINITY_DN7306_c0_g1~~TRINITY_DN7306_c0_g1_i4.p1  ORF type:complete len:576 (-),score=102.64 TRINITY_DN7306_c0_g1_i4:156-1883(-)